MGLGGSSGLWLGLRCVTARSCSSGRGAERKARRAVLPARGSRHLAAAQPSPARPTQAPGLPSGCCRGSLPGCGDWRGLGYQGWEEANATPS